MSKQLTIKDVAKIMGKSERTVYRYVKTGKLSAVNVKNKKGYEYKIPEESIRQFQCQNVNSNCQSQNVNVKAVKIAEYKELLMRHEQLIFRLAQLENMRPMLEEKAKSLQNQLHEKDEKIHQLTLQLNEKQKIIENLARKKWWEFWKKPISQLLSEPSQL